MTTRIKSNLMMVFLSFVIFTTIGTLNASAQNAAQTNSCSTNANNLEFLALLLGFDPLTALSMSYAYYLGCLEEARIMNLVATSRAPRKLDDLFLIKKDDLFLTKKEDYI